MSYKPSRCPDCGENVQMCCCQAWAKYTKSGGGGMKTTLNKIRAHSPCKDVWEKLLTYLGKTKADDEPIRIDTIIDSNSLEDAIWCLRAVEGKDKEIRLYAVWCARQVQHLMTDQRSLDALDVAERYANGEATEEELKDASAARGVAWYAAYTANAAGSAAAWCVASSAAWYAAYAARTASGAASAAGAAGADARAASRDAAWSKMRAKQADELRRICEEG